MPGPLKSSGMSYSVLPSSPLSGAFTSTKPMLRPPGLTAFALRPFQTPPPCFSTSSRSVTPIGNSTHTGLFDVAGEGVELRAVAAGVARVLRIGRHAQRLEPVVAPRS